LVAFVLGGMDPVSRCGSNQGSLLCAAESSEWRKPVGWVEDGEGETRNSEHPLTVSHEQIANIPLHLHAVENKELSLSAHERIPPAPRHLREAVDTTNEDGGVRQHNHRTKQVDFA